MMFVCMVMYSLLNGIGVGIVFIVLKVFMNVGVGSMCSFVFFSLGNVVIGCFVNM